MSLFPYIMLIWVMVAIFELVLFARMEIAGQQVTCASYGWRVLRTGSVFTAAFAIRHFFF